MDGITALPLLKKKAPDTDIIICSTLSSRGADISMKAIQLGATDCLVKPTSSSELRSADEFRDTLVNMVRALGAQKRKDRRRAPSQKTPSVGDAKPAGDSSKAPRSTGQNYALRNGPDIYTGKPAILAIGSSTGGPQALFRCLGDIGALDIPVVITQHMPKTFTAILAQHIAQNTGIPCREGTDGMKLEAGHIYIAPGGHHMEFTSKNGPTSIKITDGPPEKFCKPSVEPMMRSLIDIYGKKVMAVILTGMGSDGRDACEQLARIGGQIYAQDEQSSVVWGMPGAVAQAGLCTKVLPLSDIGSAVRNFITKDKAA
jgi:two-component system chemotaxis response regulator CheB